MRGDRSVLTGVVYVVLATASFALLDSVAKTVVVSVPVLMAIWVRYLMQAVFTTAMLGPRHGRALWRTHYPLLQMLRGLLLLGTTMVALLALRFMPVGEFTAIVMLTPLTVTVLAVVLFGQRVAPVQWVLVVGGFAGALVVIRPGGHDFGWSAALALLCMAGNSAFQLLTSHMAARHEHPATTHFYTGWVGAAAATLALPFTWALVDSPLLWALMALMGLLAAAGHFMLTLGYHHAPVSTLMPYLYCHVGFAVLAGWLFFSHVPDAWTLAGIGLISLCGACSAWLTARNKRPVSALPGS